MRLITFFKGGQCSQLLPANCQCLARVHLIQDEEASQPSAATIFLTLYNYNIAKEFIEPVITFVNETPPGSNAGIADVIEPQY